jgi:glutamine phosphoribosylpyrophosphate amidotransferase
MTMTADDVRRVTSFSQHIQESFTVEYKNEDNTLTLKVNGTIRNSIQLDNANEEFDKILNLIKDEFIAFRSKNVTN